MLTEWARGACCVALHRYKMKREHSNSSSYTKQIKVQKTNKTKLKINNCVCVRLQFYGIRCSVCLFCIFSRRILLLLPLLRTAFICFD